MISNEEKELARRLLWNDLDNTGIIRLFSTFDKNSSLRDHLVNQSSLEALFYSMSWEMQESPGFDSLLPGVESDAGIQIPEEEWQSIVDRAFKAPKPPERTARLFKFPGIVRYLAAACFIGLLIGGTLLIQNFRNKMGPNKTAAFTDGENVPEKVIPGPGSSTRRTFLFDSIVIYTSPAAINKSFAIDRNEGIVRLGERTAILLEKRSQLSVAEQTDSMVLINFTQGSGLFTVEKHRYHMFTVATPAADISVTGTIFRLTVQNQATIVSVLEGTVNAKGKNSASPTTVRAGMSVTIRNDTAIFENGDTAAMLLYRCNLLHDFLMENGVYEDGCFVRAGMTVVSDTIAVSFNKLQVDSAGEDENAFIQKGISNWAKRAHGIDDFLHPDGQDRFK